MHESSLNSWKFSPSGRTRRGARGCSPGARLPRSARALKAGGLPRAGGAGSRDLLTSPALLQDMTRPTPSQRSTCSPHPTQKHGRSALSWSLPLMPRRDEPGHPLLVSPSGPEVGPPLALTLKGVRHAHRRLSSLSTSFLLPSRPAHCSRHSDFLRPIVANLKKNFIMDNSQTCTG